VEIETRPRQAPTIRESQRRRKETALSIILSAHAIQRSLAAAEKSRTLLLATGRAIAA
jgi:hypothetical protein